MKASEEKLKRVYEFEREEEEGVWGFIGRVLTDEKKKARFVRG